LNYPEKKGLMCIEGVEGKKRYMKVMCKWGTAGTVAPKINGQVHFPCGGHVLEQNEREI
jgi:hypothetical protein